MHEVSLRISRVLDQDQRSRICPESYQHLDGRDLIERPGLKVLTIGVAVAGLCLVVLAVNFLLFHTASQGLANALREILQHDLWSTK
jgi:hypothetical protein